MKKDHQNIKNLREYAGVTQEDLAIALNKSIKTIQRYESGESIPSVATRKRIYDILGQAIPEDQNIDLIDGTVINLLMQNNAMLSVSLDVMAELLTASNPKTTYSENRSSLAKAVENKLEMLKGSDKS